jgi:ligand-binding sensor domain-containing protein
MKNILFTVFIFLCIVRGDAQQYYMRHFGVEDGLPSSETYDVMQDRHGFIWISTDRGVSRYDSYAFRNFSTADGLTDNTVFSAQEDEEGKIWFATLHGGLCYSAGDTILPYPYNHLLKDSLGEIIVIQSFSAQSSGEVIVGRQAYGCIQIDKDGNSSRPYHVHTETGFVYQVLKSGRTMVGSSYENNPQQYQNLSAVVCINENGHFRHYKMELQRNSAFNQIMACSDGRYLFAADNILLEVQPDGSSRQYSVAARITKLVEDAAGNIWIGMLNAGVKKYARGADLSSEDYEYFLPNETVTDVIQDRESAYWFSTLDHGVYYMSSTAVHWLTMNNGINEASVTAMSRSTNGKVLVGTTGGQIYRAGATGIRLCVDWSKENNHIDFVRDLYCMPDQSGTWVGTGHSLFFLESDSIMRPVLRTGYAKSVTGDGAKGSWIGVMNGIRHFPDVSSPGEDNCIRFAGWPQDLYWDTLSSLLIIGDMNGLRYVNKDSVQPYPLADGPLTVRVNSVIGWGTKLVAATMGEGVCIIEKGTLKKISTQQGLSSPLVNDVDVDSEGNIWAATNSGLSQIVFTGDTFVIHNYTIFHGLPTNEINRVLCHDSRVWVGTSIGVAWFFPHEMLQERVAPPIYIEHVSVNGLARNSDSTWQFDHDDNHVRFSFLGISFRNAGNTIYRYRLLGLDSQWVLTDNRSVEFASLPPGDYRFEVMARNDDGTWSLSPDTFAFVIQPPFWSTWWFWIGSVALLIGITAFFINRRLRNVRYMAQQKTILAEYQHQALAAQMNPHFIFNSLTSMQAFILGDEKENALRYVDRFAFLMRKSMEHSVLKFVPLEKEVDLLRAYFDLEAMRFGDRLTCTITIDDSTDMSGIEVPAMLVQPFAENAIRHGVVHRNEPGGYVNVLFEWRNGALWCTVDDNGIGRKRSAEINRSRRRHISFGSSITEERLRTLCEVMKQHFHLTCTDKYNQDGTAAGTTIYFMLPSRKRESHA